MKKQLSIIFTILSGILILDSMNLGHAVTMFLLAGIIPGTNLVVSGEQMLNACVFLIGFILARITVGALQAYGAARQQSPDSTTLI